MMTDMTKRKSRRRRPLQAAAAPATAATALTLALLALSPPIPTAAFAVVGGCRGGYRFTRMSQAVVDAAVPAARMEVHERELDPNMPVPKDRLFGMPLSR